MPESVSNMKLKTFKSFHLTDSPELLLLFEIHKKNIWRRKPENIHILQDEMRQFWFLISKN